MKMQWKKGLLVAAALVLASGTANMARAGYDEDGSMAMGSNTSNMSMSSDMMRQKNAQMLIQTLSEEKTEINALAAQQARFRAMGDMESMKIARLWGVWIREHKAAGPMLMRLIRLNGGDPMQARILKAPPLGSKEAMLMATHKDHEAAVMTSQMRYGMTNSRAIKMAMNKRANLARKHIRQMMPYHDMKMGNMNMGTGMGMSRTRTTTTTTTTRTDGMDMDDMNTNDTSTDTTGTQSTTTATIDNSASTDSTVTSETTVDNSATTDEMTAGETTTGETTTGETTMDENM